MSSVWQKIENASKKPQKPLKDNFDREMDIRYGFSDPKNPINPSFSPKNSKKKFGAKNVKMAAKGLKILFQKIFFSDAIKTSPEH